MKRIIRKIKRHRFLKFARAIGQSERARGIACTLCAVAGITLVIGPDYVEVDIPVEQLHILGSVMMVIGILLSATENRNTVRRVRKISGSANDMLDGKSLNSLYSHDLGPFGDLARTINTLYFNGIRASRLRSGLDAASTMVMISNTNGNIVYVNPAIQAQFTTHRERIVEQFPNVDPENLIGTSVSTFYTSLNELDDAARAELRAGENHTHEGVTHIGGRKLRVRVTPALDPDGTVIGHVTQWIDLTSEFEMENEIENLVEMIELGELDIRVAVEDKANSYYKIATGVNALTGFVGQALDDINDLVSKMASGDLSHKIESEYFGRFGEIVDNSNTMVAKFSETVDHIRSDSDSLNSAIGSISASTDRLSGQFDQTAQQLAQTSAATAKIAESVQQTAENARSAEAHAQAARTAAVSGATVVRNAAATMNEIEASSKRVSDIIGVIDDIAFQTNLLALNAAVEAARAGDAGKGFSVVASEVRSLAQRASDSASDIKSLVDASMTDVRRGVDQAEQTGQALNEIQEAVNTVAGLIDTITSATTTQEQDAARIAESLETMTNVTQENNAMAADTASSVRSMANLSDGLQNVIAFFSSDGNFAQREAVQAVDLGPSSIDTVDDDGGPPAWVESDLDKEFAWDDQTSEMTAQNA
ncbi:MAG: methyl-accepting chemotaxis protein [Pseudomonadota bacterium]